MKLTKSFANLVGPALLKVVKGLKNLPKMTYGEACASGAAKKGIYLIFDEKGILLYVGFSKNLRHRVASHLTSDDPLMRDFLSAAGIQEKHVHRCSCGNLLECRSGQEIAPGFQEAYEALKVRIRAQFQVALVYEEDSITIGGRSFERFVQWVLRPKYGYWHHYTKGQARIAEDFSEPAIEDVLKELA